MCLPEPCLAGEVRVQGACARVGNLVCAEGFAPAPDGGCVSTLPTTCPDPLVAFPGETACHALDECPASQFPAVDGAAVYVDGSAPAGGDGTSARPVRSLGAAIALARAGKVPRVLVAAGNYPESILIDTPLELRGVCSAKVRIAPPDSMAAETTISVTADATVSGLTLVGKSFRRGLAAVGGASLSIDHVSVRGYIVGIENARVANPKVPKLGLSSVSFFDVLIALESHIPVDLERLFIHGSTEAVRLHADGAIRASLIEDTSATALLVSSGKVVVERSVIRRVAPSTYGSLGIHADDADGSGATDVTVGASVFSEIAGEALAASAARLVVHDTSIRDGGAPSDNHLSVGILGRKRADLEVRDVSVVRPFLSGICAFGAAASVERTWIRDVIDPNFGAGLTLFWGSAEAPQALSAVLIERPIGAGLYVYAGQATATDLRIVDPQKSNFEGGYGDGIDVLRGEDGSKESPARLEASGIVVENAPRAAIGVFAADLVLRDSRLCGAFDLEASNQALTLEAPYTMVDGGGNVCGCGAPLSACRTAAHSLQPMLPPAF